MVNDGERWLNCNTRWWFQPLLKNISQWEGWQTIYEMEKNMFETTNQIKQKEFESHMAKNGPAVDPRP